MSRENTTNPLIAIAPECDGCGWSNNKTLRFGHDVGIMRRITAVASVVSQSFFAEESRVEAVFLPRKRFFSE